MRPHLQAVLGTVPALAGVLLLAGLAGCGRDALLDERNIYYIRGMKLREARKHEEAVEAFQTCLRLSPQSALAHLQLAMIYDGTLDDPLSAVYHYRRFLEMRPDHPEAEAVRGWLAKAEQTLARRLYQAAAYAAAGQDGIPAGASDTAGPTPRELALLERIRELTEANEELRRALKEPVIDPSLLPPAPGGGTAVRPAAPPETPRPAAATAAGTAPAPAPGPAAAPAPAPAQAPSPAAAAAAHAGAPTRAATPAVPSPAAAAGDRVHVVAAGESLASLCRRYYGNVSLWPRLQQANRDVLGDRSDLKVGMRLRIPPAEQLRALPAAPTGSR